MLNSNWAVKLSQVKTPEAKKTEFNQDALKNHQQNGGYVSKMLQGMDWNGEIGDVNGRLEGLTGETAVPEFGSEEAVQGAANDMIGDIAAAEDDALEVNPKTDFTVALGTVNTPEAKKIEFDKSALANHQQNGLKGTIKNMLPSIIGMIGAA